MTSFSTKTPQIGRSPCNVKNKSQVTLAKIWDMPPKGEVMEREDRGRIKKYKRVPRKN